MKIATPDADGQIYHVVQAGQSFWLIAIAYQITIHDLERWNNLSRDVPLQAGQRLFIPGKDTKGFATPTPFGMIVPQASDANGKIVHEVQPYQTLITIAEAYHVSVNQILALNGLQADWPLQIGQKLVISPGNITPSPTLSALQRLTPEANGHYYHTVHSGETLSWIADLYEVPLADLMAWNGLDGTSIIRPEQRLLLLVTPPPTPTLIPSPTTTAMPSASPSMPATVTGTPPETVAAPPPELSLGLISGVIAVGIGGLLGWRFWHKR